MFVELGGMLVLAMAASIPLSMWQEYRRMSPREAQLLRVWSGLPSAIFGSDASIQRDVTVGFLAVILTTVVLAGLNRIHAGHAILIALYPALLSLAWQAFATRLQEA